jgi:hypothetical protein
MITGVHVAERNDQVAGTKGSDVRTNGDCVGTRYGGMTRDIYRKRGERMVSRVSSEAEGRELDSRIDMESQASSEAKAWELDSGNRSREWTLTVPPPAGQTHEAISEIREIAGWYVR